MPTPDDPSTPEHAASLPGLDDGLALLQQAPVAIALLTGPEHRFQIANPHYLRLADRDDVIGRRWDEVFPELLDGPLPAILRDAYESGTPHASREMKLTLQRQGRAQEAWFRFSVEPMRDAAGRVAAVMLAGTEITDEVRSRHALETAFKERQRLAVELDRASRTKHEFLAMLGHELRNPLAPIVSALELMQLKDPADTRWEQDVIRRQVERLTSLLDDLLGAGSVARGQVALRRQPVEIGDMLAEAADMAAPALKAHDQRLSIDVERGRLACRGDPLRLAQAVSNLLTNAARYSPRGGCIELHAGRDGDAVVIRVKDEGSGIAADVLPRVFELFFQGPQPTNGADAGMGVGLTIAKNLVEMHGGTIAATSDGPGRGAEFVIRLPRMTEIDVLTDRGSLGELPGAEAEMRRQRILVVDDNEDAAQSLAALLRLDGHQVMVATSPAQALDAVPGLLPHVALLDIGLPGMTGYDLGARIRELLEPRGCRLFAITGYSDESDRKRSAELGFVEHLVKPVNHELLLRHLADSTPQVAHS